MIDTSNTGSSCKIDQYGTLNHGKNKNTFLFLISLVIVWSLIIYFYHPTEIVEILGIRNVYIFIFLLAMIGGVSMFTTTFFYTSLATIAFGGVNIVWLALYASIGLLFGDLIFYYLAKSGSQCAPAKYASIIEKLRNWMSKLKDIEIVFLIFVYSLTPLPSDAISIVLGIYSFPIKKMVLPLIIGKFFLILVFIELVMLGYTFLL
ncbi:VTT domain-containing protein [Methanosalsum natronophilum]|uniref:VTT domain-containing protein n=1 Tax=Methanosalsum natronophilum TaxID=768733 RepID=UPI0021687519|nr:VTT domain-containing protein [Methanosalsum natronophilum]MCS3924875.1 membrane protein YqaA with SNARE-associated domain [Methanosalsum natronophilum]